MATNKTRILLILTPLVLLASCQSRVEDSSNSQNISKLSVKFGAAADLNSVNSNEAYFKFGHKSFVVEDLSEFIAHKGAQGWTSEFTFPPSGNLTGVACQEPNLIGFTTVNTSEASEIRRYINLAKATKLEAKMLEPRNSQYEPKELELMPQSRFGVYLQGQKRQIETLCFVKFSHFPGKDFTPYFEISKTDMIMKNDRRSIFDLDLINSKVSMTKVTIMGVVRIDGNLVGFTANDDITVVYN